MSQLSVVERHPVGRPRAGEYRCCVDCGKEIYVKRCSLQANPDQGKRCRDCNCRAAVPRLRDGRRLTQMLKHYGLKPSHLQDTLPCGKARRDCVNCPDIFSGQCVWS